MVKLMFKQFLIFILLFTLNSCDMSSLSKNKKYELYPSGNAHKFYPALQFSGTIFFEDGTNVYIPFSYSYAPVWGESGGVHLLDNDNMFALPDSIAIVWLSIVENKFYGVHAPLPKERIKELLQMKDPETKEQLFENIVFGMAPYGGLAVWLEGATRCVKYTIEIAWIQGEEADIDFYDFRPDSKQTGEEYCEWMLQNNEEEAYANLKENGLPDKELFNNYMAKFNYRIVPVFEKTDTEFKVTSVHYYDGEFFMVRYNIGEYNIKDIIMRYDLFEPKAKPYKINITWKGGNDLYDAYFWTDEKKIIETFANFYQDNAEKEGELVVEIGKDNDKFRIFLQDDSIVVEIPVEEMEIIVFKNEFEFFRSENYSKPPQGWRN